MKCFSTSATRQLKYGLVFASSFLYIHIPNAKFIIPIACGANLIIIAYAIIEFRPLLINGKLFAVAGMTAFYLAYHYTLGHINATTLGIEFARFGLTNLTIPLYASLVYRFRPETQIQIRKAYIAISLTIFTLELALRLSLYPNEFLHAAAYAFRSDDVYNIKATNLLYKDSNMLAVVIAFFFGAYLYETLSSQKKPSWLIVTLFAVLEIFTFSRQGYISFFGMAPIYYGLSQNSLRKFIERHFTSIAFVFSLALSFALYEVIKNITFIRDEYALWSAGAIAKLSMLEYLYAYLTHASLLGYVFGWGPQVAHTRFVVEYFGHDLAGIIPEFGIFSIILIYPFFAVNKHLALILFPFYFGILFSYYGYAYIMPCLLYIVLLDASAPKRRKSRAAALASHPLHSTN